jgi:SET domain
LYSETELSLFEGTTLVPAVRAKIRKLQAEFDLLRKSTNSLKWLDEIWWDSARPQTQLQAILAQLGAEIEANEDEDEDENDGPDSLLRFDDWLLLDAMFRSRAMEWPGEGDAMVPGIDFANHTVPANAEYEVNNDRKGELQVKGSITIKQDEEVLISYGDHKSALEVLFSYGFWPDYQCPPSILLSLPNPDDDPLGPPKVAIVSGSRSVPGIKIYEENDVIQWDSEALWLMIVNEEDGLGFKVAYGPGNERELHMTWKDSVVELGELRKALEQDDQWDLFQLRATVIVLQQADSQLSALHEASQTLLNPESELSERLEYLRSVAGKLRSTEKETLVTAMEHLQEKVLSSIVMMNTA